MYKELTITEDAFKALLKEAGFEGMVAEDRSCGCTLEQFRPCETDDLTGCLPGYVEKQPDGCEYDFLVYPGKRPAA